MKEPLRLVCLALIGCATLSVGAAAHAAAQARLQVSATVQAMASLTVSAQPAGLVLTPDDIARGFLLVTQPTVLALSSNSAQGIALEIATVTALFSAVTVHGLDSDATLAGQGGTVTHRWAVPQPLALTLTFTFYLKPDTQAGNYPWPLALSARALETL